MSTMLFKPEFRQLTLGLYFVFIKKQYIINEWGIFITKNEMNFQI
jgi:hypothetical protein